MFTTAPELTTSISDLILAIISTALTIWISIENSKRKNKKVNVIIAMLVFLSVISFYGAGLHGFAMDRKIWKIAWIPLSILLACIPLLILILMAMIWKKENVSAKRLALYCTMQVVFSLTSAITVAVIQKDVAFDTFIALFASICATAFVMSVVIGIKSKRPSSAFFSVGITVMLVATILQEVLKQQGFTFVVKWLFDYNTIYHLMMIFAVIIATIGIKLYLNEEDKIAANRLLDTAQLNKEPSID